MRSSPPVFQVVLGVPRSRLLSPTPPPPTDPSSCPSVASSSFRPTVSTMHLRGCKQQGHWSWRKLDKQTAMAVTATRRSDSDVEQDGSEKDVKVSTPTYATVPYQQ